MHPPEVDIHTYTGAAWLGIDAGSTTTKIALITADGGLLYTYYHSNLGNPVAIVLEQLREIYKLCGSRITIKGAAVTGYGEDLIKTPSPATPGWWRRWPTTAPPATSTPTWTSSSTSAART